ncbi:MAG TPA: DciA family protein [Bacillota bacterium]|nr:DciA family protein [Bacillota bacterium]
MKVSSCAGIIEQYFRKSGGWKRLQGELSIYYWPRIVGSEIASKTEAVFFRNGYLYVQTDNPSLAHQLSLLCPDILKKYQTVLGRDVLKGIKVKIGTINTKSASQDNGDHAVDLCLDEREQQKINECLENIKDPELAQVFGQTMRRVLAYQQRLLKEGGHRCQSCQAVIEPSFVYCPICERKINEETQALLGYIKKNQKTLTLDEIQMFDEANHPFITEVAKTDKTGGI